MYQRHTYRKLEFADIYKVVSLAILYSRFCDFNDVILLQRSRGCPVSVRHCQALDLREC